MKLKLLLLPVLTVCSSAQVGLGLSPMRVELNLEPGASHSGALDLANEVATTTRIRGELLDFRIDETTTPQFLRSLPGEAANTCREWLTVNPMETEMDTTQHVIIRYTIRVPKTASPRSYYCAVGYTTLPPAEKLKEAGMRTAVRIVTTFYVVVGKSKPEGEISALLFEPVPGAKDGSYRTVLVVKNSGDYYFRPMGTVELLSATGATLETIQVPAFPALPQRDQRYVLPVTTPNPADVKRVKASVDLGSHEIQEASIDVAPAAAAQ